VTSRLSLQLSVTSTFSCSQQNLGRTGSLLNRADLTPRSEVNFLSVTLFASCPSPFSRLAVKGRSQLS